MAETDKKPEYGLTDYMTPISGALADVTSLATSRDKYKHGATAKTVAGAGLGAVGAAVAGPVGAMIGQKLGSLVGGIVGGAKDKELYLRDHRNLMERKYQKLNMSFNVDPYGTSSVQYAEDGGVVQGGEEQPEMQMVNIERGEILVDPVTLDVIREYSNPKRYKPHTKNPNDEPVGNFTFIEPGKIVVPKKHAERFKGGDKLAKTSILAQLIKEQQMNGTPMVSAPGAGRVPQAADGLVTDPPTWSTDKARVSAFQKWYNSTYTDKPLNLGKNSKNLGTWGPNTLNAWNSTGQLYDFLNPQKKAPLVDESTADKPPAPPADEAEVIGSLKKKELEKDAITTGLNSGILQVKTDEETGLPYSISDTKKQIDFYRQGPDKPADSSGSKDGKKSPGINEVDLAKALNFLPTAYGLGVAMERDPFLRYDEQDFSQAEAYANAIPTDVNIEAAKTAMRGKSRGINQALNNIVSPSVRAEIASNRAAEIGAESDLIQDAVNQTMTARGNKLAGLSQLATSKEQARFNARTMFRDALRKDRATRQTMIQAGLSEGVTNYGKQVIDQEQINAINSFLTYNKIKPGQTLNVSDTGEFSKMVLALFKQAGLFGDMNRSVTGKKG